MSQNNRTSNNDIDSKKEASPDPELEELIASVMAIKKSNRQNKAEGTEKTARPRSSAPKAAAQGNTTGTERRPAPSRQNVQSGQRQSASRPAGKRPQSASRTGVKNPAPSGGGAKNSTDPRRTTANRSGERTTAVNRNGTRRAENQNAPRRPVNPDASRRTVSQNGVGRPVAAAAGAIPASAEISAPTPTSGAAVKKGFRSWSTKKKAGVIAGFVFLALCIIALAVWIKFEGYVSLLNRDNGGFNSDRPNYGDADPTKEDTLSLEEEEARLKAQLEQSASSIMSDSNVYNILLIGEDIRDTAAEERGNTDVMMLISINSELETITMTSFMRDIYLYLPSTSDVQLSYSNRLNAAYYHGGAIYLEDVLEQYFGVTIDRYVVVNFYSFIDIVDTVGGLNITLSDEEAIGMQEPMAEQNKYLGNASGTDYLYQGGEDLLLNGNQALGYARLRYVGNADFERTERQRKVIAEMIEKSKELNLLELDSLLNRVLPEVTTDLESGEIATLLLNAFDYMNYDIQELRIPADGTFTNEYINGMSVLSVDFDSNMQLLQQTVYGESAVDSSSEYDDYGQYGNDTTAGTTGGYYDQYGNWVNTEGGYYDAYGNWISGYYDEYGNWISY